MINTPKPSSATFANTAKPAFAELWSTITTTWATETRTWNDCASLFTNTAKPTSATMTNTPKP